MPTWVPIVLSSAAVSAFVSLIGNVLLSWWSARAFKIRKYEEELIHNRVAKCNELLQLVYELCHHLSPVAKGTRTLESRGSGLGPNGPDSEVEKQEIERTQTLRKGIYDFVEANALYLGREVCLSAIYFDCGFDALALKLSMAEGKSSHAFYALCRWTWKFEDGVKDAIRKSLANATFSPPSSLEIGAARTTGYQDMDALVEAVEKDPSAYSIDARNKELREHTSSLSLPK